MEAAGAFAQVAGVSASCRALSIPRSSVYRARGPHVQRAARPTPERALSADERARVREVLDSQRFCDASPRQVYATLLDEGVYHCHWRTMYRVLAEHDEVRERRDQRSYPAFAKPELLATGPKQLWSWDITKLRGPRKWTYYYLYVVLDVFSRCVVGWMIGERESATLAEELIGETCARQGIAIGQLTLHADRGSSMRSKTIAQLLADLGVTKTHTRPYTASDNPFSEAQFKTMKYRPDYPACFGCLSDARQWARGFFQWYNHRHHHSALGLMTPAAVHYGQAEAIYRQRERVLQAAYRARPERFVRGQPMPPDLPTAVWINPPGGGDRQPGRVSTPSTAQPGSGLAEAALFVPDTRLELSQHA